MRALLALLALLLASPASAAGEATPVDAEAAAMEAEAAFDEFCSETALEETTRAIGAVATVGDAWRNVSAALDSTDAVFLYYWRGVLGQCMDQEERALSDLQVFLERTDGQSAWSDLRGRARKRVRRLELQMAGGPKNPGVGAGVAGAALAAGGGVCAGLAGWQWSVAVAAGQQLVQEPHESNALTELGLQGSQANSIKTGLVIGGAALGTGAVISWIVSGGQKARATASLGVRGPVFAVVPTPSGAAVALGGRW